MRQTFITVLLLCSLGATAQQSVFTPKHFLATLDSGEFQSISPAENGKEISYTVSGAIGVIYVKDTQFINTVVTGAVVLKVGQIRNGKREGIFNVYLIDSLDHSLKYKIGEVDFSAGEMSGESRLYTLSGTLFRVVKIKSGGVLDNIKEYATDGTTLLHETIYQGDPFTYIQKDYDHQGQVIQETHFVHGVRQ